jgi:tRNA modification GTPase
VGLYTLQEKSHAFLNNARHLDSVQKAIVSLTRAHQALADKIAAECVAADLQSAVHSLEALLGKVSSEDVLDKIFSEFCIGK